VPRLDRSHIEDRPLSTRWVEVRFPGRDPRLSGSNHGSGGSVGTRPQKRSHRSWRQGDHGRPRFSQDRGYTPRRPQGPYVAGAVQRPGLQVACSVPEDKR
jgi:hypothetical protein